MYISRINIVNFRNFANLDVALAGNIVIVGENRVGKSNLLYALRLIFDPTLPDSARQLMLSDFWDGLENPGPEDIIIVSVDIKEFENDPDVLSLLTDFRLDEDPHTVRLTYEFRPRSDLEDDPASEDDYEFICYGGENEAKDFGHGVRRRIPMDLLPALRDAEADLSTWRRSPLRPLIEDAFSGVDRQDLDEIKDAIEEATEKLTEFDSVKELEEKLGGLFLAMSGPKQDVRPGLGFGATDIARIYRNIRLLIDEGRRTITDASLGSANIVFLTLKALELKRQIEQNKRDHTLLAIEEPEAHLHPHLQRSVYRHLFAGFRNEDEESPLSIVLTTHSPHVASIAPLRSILLLKDAGEAGTVGRSTASIELTDAEIEDLTRYLDVTRAEMLFARGIILVEGDAEKFLLPVFAETMGHALDHLGITVCSVAGTNFTPYVKFLAALGIPFSVITDWDPVNGRKPLGMKRAAKLVLAAAKTRMGEIPEELGDEIYDMLRTRDEAGLSDKCEEFGIFTNYHTLEVDLFRAEYAEPIIATLEEHRFSTERQGWIENWSTNPDTLDVDDFLKLIEVIGKGRFAQRLATRIGGMVPPEYIRRAIEFVVRRV